MGVYIVSMGLTCEPTTTEEQARFAEMNTADLQKALALIVLPPIFTAPDQTGKAPQALVDAIHDVLKQQLAEVILDELTDKTKPVTAVTVFTGWSQPTGSKPHEGGPSPITYKLKDSAHFVQWRITGNSSAPYVQAYAVWRYIDVGVSMQ